MRTAPVLPTGGMPDRGMPAWAVSVGAIVLLAWAAVVASLALPTSHAVSAIAVGWMVMVVAMMVPTVARPIRRIAAGRSSRAYAFLGGYVVAWTVTVPIAGLVMSAPVWNMASALALVFGVGLYQLLPTTARNLRRCRSLDASASAWSLGLRQGWSCTIACLPMMIAVMVAIMVTGAGPVASTALLLAACGFMIWEKSPAVPIAAIRASGVALVLASAIAFTVGLGMGAGTQHHGVSAQETGVSRS